MGGTKNPSTSEASSTELSVIKQNVYLSCEAVRERVIEMNYRKQY